MRTDNQVSSIAESEHPTKGSMATFPVRDVPSLSRSLPMNCGVSRPSASSAHRNHPGKRYAALSIQQRGVSVDLFGTKLPRQLTAHGPDSSGPDAIDELAESVPHACRDTRFTRPWFFALAALAASGRGSSPWPPLPHQAWPPRLPCDRPRGVLASTHYERGSISGRLGWLLEASAPPHARSPRRT